MDCIFVDIPKECLFFHSEECVAPESHLLLCADSHKHLMLTEEGKRELVQTFINNVIESPGRIKVKSGQEGRELLL